MNKLVWKYLKSSIRGKKLLRKLTREIKLSVLVETAIILFPEPDEIINEYGVMYADEYAIRSSSELTIIIYCNDSVSDLIKKYIKNDVMLFQVDENVMEDIINFYRLFSFSRKLKIISLDLPAFRNGRNLLSYSRMDEELLVGIGIYGLLPFRRMSGRTDGSSQ